MEIKIRKGTEGDIQALFGLVVELANFEKSDVSVTNSAEQMRREKDFFEFLVAETHEEIIGIAVYFPTYSTWVGKSLYLDDLYVREKYRNQKVGTRLLREVFKIAQEGGFNRIRWQVLDWNTNAKKFYEKIGAQLGDGWLNCDFDIIAINRFLNNAD
jgi:GNAT superfamily N-acetyltransferase